MASIIRQIDIDAPADTIWDALRDFSAVHERLAADFVTDTRMESDDVRVVTFFNGAQARERLVTIDDERRRLVYTVIESALNATHDNSSAEVIDLGDGTSRFLWIKDVLPESIAPVISGLMDRGIGMVKQTIEGQRVGSGQIADSSS